MLQQLLKTGAEVQAQNVKAMQGLFDAFWTEAGKMETGRMEAGKPDAAPAAGQGAGQGAGHGTDAAQPGPQAERRSRGPESR